MAMQGGCQMSSAAHEVKLLAKVAPVNVARLLRLDPDSLTRAGTQRLPAHTGA